MKVGGFLTAGTNYRVAWIGWLLFRRKILFQTRLTTLLGLLFIGSIASARDHVLVIGGGPSPASSQLSIERNVVFIRQALANMGRTDIQPEVLFASGPEAVPDVCVDQTTAVPRAIKLLADIVGESKGINLGYRCHDVGSVQGPADRPTIFQSLERYAKELKQGDRLVIYVTGHGGKGNPSTNGMLHTWNDGELRVRDFAEALDAFSPDVEVIVVMVQCYSGTFANLVFESGDPEKSASRHHRAGFFATVDSRPAAGCTADTKIEDYKEYSTSFFAALAGKSRDGQEVHAEDIDGDGHISMAEAHAFTVENSPTIDICYRTSDRFLEKEARLDSKDEKLMPKEASLAALKEVADPIRRHVIDKLVAELEINAESPLADAEKLSKEISEDRRRTRALIGSIDNNAGKMAKKIKDVLIVRWPFLNNPWHPETHTLVANESDDVVKFIEGQSGFVAWKRLVDRAKTLRTQDLNKERKWAKAQRLILTAKSIVRAENLRREGSAELVDRYEQLLRLENSVLTPLPAVSSPVAN